jgi:Fe-S-cluster containining protein
MIVEDLVISEDILTEFFVCNLNSCKGACCWEGDFGAPLDKSELEILKQITPKVLSYLPEKSIQILSEHGPYQWYEENEEFGTTLVDNGPCVFMTKDELGIAKCGIEAAWKDGKINWRKPSSCHLYPIRVVKNKNGDDYALNYDRWEICSNACDGKSSLKVPLYEFVKDALIHRYGEEFYQQLTGLKEYLEHSTENNE